MESENINNVQKIKRIVTKMRNFHESGQNYELTIKPKITKALSYFIKCVTNSWQEHTIYSDISQSLDLLNLSQGINVDGIPNALEGPHIVAAQADENLTNIKNIMDTQYNVDEESANKITDLVSKILELKLNEVDPLDVEIDYLESHELKGFNLEEIAKLMENKDDIKSLESIVDKMYQEADTDEAKTNLLETLKRLFLNIEYEHNPDQIEADKLSLRLFLDSELRGQKIQEQRQKRDKILKEINDGFLFELKNNLIILGFEISEIPKIDRYFNLE